MRLCDCLHLALVFSLLAAEVPCALGQSDSGGDSVSKIEIKKFRFAKVKKKNYERLVIEFANRGSAKGVPDLKLVPNASGKEAVVYLDQVQLVGAIPEALINDSYVSHSAYLGPVSINTEGVGHSFSVRAFLKDAVSVDAFILQHPTRLVLDAFPSDSPRAEGPWENHDRDIASTPNKKKSTRHEALSDDLSQKIVCYPASQQVIATVSFHPKANENVSGVELTNVTNLENFLATSNRKPVETAICFPASSRLEANIGFAPRGSDITYVQPDASALAPLPNSMMMTPATPAAPNASRALLSTAPAKTVDPLVTSVTPGPSKLGSLLPPQSSIQRLPGAAPQLLPSNSGVGSGNSMGPTAGNGSATPKPALNAGNLLPPLK